MKKMMLVMTMLTAATAASAAGPAVMDECLSVKAAAQQVSGDEYKITAGVSWTCDPELVGLGTLRMRVNGEPAGEAVSFDGSGTAMLAATVKTDMLPPKVCVQLGATDAAGNPTVAASACTNAIVLSTVVDGGAPTLPTVPTLPGNRRGHVRR